MSKEIIRRGLEAFEKSGAKSTLDMDMVGSISELSGLSTTLGTISALRTATKEVRDRLLSIKSRVAGELEGRAEQIRRDYADMGFSPRDSGPGRIDVKGPAWRRENRDEALRTMRKKFLDASKEEIAELIGKIAEHRDELRLLKDAWASPIDVLKRSTFNSEERVRATQVLAGADIGELNQAAAEAVRTNNRGLAAAVCVSLKGISDEQKQLMRFSPEQISASVMHKEFAAVNEGLQMSEYYLNSAKISSSDIDGTPTSPEDKIAVGLIKCDLARATGKTEEELDPAPTVYDGKGEIKITSYVEQNKTHIDVLDARRRAGL